MIAVRLENSHEPNRTSESGRSELGKYGGKRHRAQGEFSLGSKSPRGVQIAHDVMRWRNRKPKVEIPPSVATRRARSMTEVLPVPLGRSVKERPDPLAPPL